MVIASCVLIEFKINERITSTTPVSAIFDYHHHFVVEQERWKWNNVTYCYLTPSTSLYPSTIHWLLCWFERDPNQELLTEKKNCLCLIWIPSQTALARIWTIETLNFGEEILIFLTVSVPIVACARVHIFIRIEDYTVYISSIWVPQNWLLASKTSIVYHVI